MKKILNLLALLCISIAGWAQTASGLTGYGEPLTLDQFKALAGTGKRFGFVATSVTAQATEPRCDHWMRFTSEHTGTLDDTALFYLEESTTTDGCYKVKRVSDGLYVNATAEGTTFDETGCDFRLVNRDPNDDLKLLTGAQSISFENPTNSSLHYNANAVKYNGGAGSWTTYAIYGALYKVTLNCVNESNEPVRPSQTFYVVDGTTIEAPEISGKAAQGETSVTVNGADAVLTVVYAESTYDYALVVNGAVPGMTITIKGESVEYGASNVSSTSAVTAEDVVVTFPAEYSSWAYYVTISGSTITVNCYDTAADDQFVPATDTYNTADNEPAPVHPVPSQRQLLWQETEFYAFFHFGMNTFTNSEWGNGGEAESRFAPKKLPNPKQWLTAVKAAGMKGGIAVVKHHDGFCLWPTATTTHSVVNAGNDNGRNTNIPADFASAARELGMKYGFYVSPWDLNSKYWGDGTSDYVNKVFLPQCLELAQYGSDQFEMWFDGATGGDHAGYYGGANTTRTIPNAATYYDIPNLRDTVHAIAPNCVMWGVGDEARWIGNEQGWAGETNWSMGSGESGNMNAWKWKAGESDAKATDKGWFWHSGESPKSASALFKIYLETVGRNATLILNFPPDQNGELPTADVNVLQQLGDLITNRLTNDKAKTAKSITASATRSAGATRNYSINNVTDDNKDTYWATDNNDLSASITLEWDEEQSLYYVMLMEYIKLGQRVKKFTIETSLDGDSWTKRASGTTTTIGYKRIVPLNGSTSTYSAVKAKYLRITIDDARGCPTLHTLSVF